MGNSIPSVLNIGGKVLKVKAEGSHGTIFTCEDELGNEYSLKLKRVQRRKSGEIADEDIAEAMTTEQAVLKRISSHPNILRMIDCGVKWHENEVQYHILSEFCPLSASNLLSDARKSGFLSERDIMYILRDVLSALVHLHSQTPPVAHRNIKVETILLGSDNRFKLSSFGSCSVRHRAFTASRDIAEAKDEIRRRTTPAYRAPEQVDLQAGHIVSERVDIWAVGVLLFKLAFDRTPFEDSRGDIQNLRILGGYKIEQMPSANPYSIGYSTLLQVCLNPIPGKRPSSSSLIRRCENMHADGDLPYWPTPNDLFSGSTELQYRIPTSFSEGGRTPPRRNSNRSRSFMDDTQHSENSALLRKSPSLRKNDINNSFAPEQEQGGGSRIRRKSVESSISTPTSRPKKDSVRRKNSASKVSLLLPSPHWMGIIGEEMKAKWYKYMDGEQQTRLWVLKTTSRIACGPKPKYVRKIVLALWDGGFAISSFFEQLRFRPMEESPIVAAKALTTLLRALQQGPPHCLMECCSYAEMIDEIGEMWACKDGNLSDSRIESSTTHDLVFAKLIVLFASAVLHKVRFNQQHPESASIFSSPYREEKKGTLHDVFEIDETRALIAVRKLLQIQNILIDVQQQAFLVLACGASDSKIVTRSLLLSLVHESFANFMAMRRLLMSLKNSDKASETLTHQDSIENDGMLLELLDEFEKQAVKLQQSYSRADEVDEVRLLGHTPQLPLGKLLESFEESSVIVHRNTQNNQNGKSPHKHSDLPAPYMWPTNKYEALRTLRHEENLLSRFVTNAVGGEDDGPSDADSEIDVDELKEIEAERRRNSDRSHTVGKQGPFSNDSSRSSNSANSKDNEGKDHSRATSCSPTLEHHFELPPQAEPELVSKQLTNGHTDLHQSGPPPQLPPRRGTLISGSSSPPPLPPRIEGKVPSVIKPLVQIKPPSIKQQIGDMSRRPISNGGKGLNKKNKQSMQQPTRSPVRYFGTAKALYEFRARSTEQLSFQAGDIIKKCRESINDKGWGLGELNGTIGWYPGDFVKDITNTIEHAPAETTTNKNSGQTGSQLTKKKSSKTVIDDKMPTEHQFAIHMARAQPWRDRLTRGGKGAYTELVNYFNNSGLVIDFDDLHLRAVIGSGAFATVFLAMYRDQEVAVKKLMGGGGGPMEKTLRDFMTEAMLLSRLQHRNIVAPIGATIEPVTIVMEYCSRGNLMMLLNDSNIDIPWQRKRQICIDMAHGMRYLHSQQPIIIHRDLKSLNVLVDENWVSKVTDFGLSRFKATSESEKMTGQAGTYHWMSPEVINSQHYTEKADVFSFGIIMWEVYTRNIPYNGMQPVQVVALVVNRRERPRIPSTCPSTLANLMQQCWHHDPKQRPPFTEIVARLESLPG